MGFRLDDLGRDVRRAVRGLWRSPGFTATVTLILALGIGANTAMFSIVHGVLLRPLPYPDSEAIVRIGEPVALSGRSDMLSNRSAALLQEHAESFEQVAVHQGRSADWDGAVLSGAWASPSLFPLLRGAPHLGRLFREDEARPGAGRVVLLSHGAWTSRFGADPSVVGTALNLDGEPHRVVGVMAEGFDYPSPDTEFWAPYVLPPPGDPDPGVRTRALGRLRPGVSPEQAAAEADGILPAGGDSSLRVLITPRAPGGIPPGVSPGQAAAGAGDVPRGAGGNFPAGTPGGIPSGVSREPAAAGAGDVPRGAGGDPLQALTADAEPGVRVVPLLEVMVGEYRPALSILSAVAVLVLLIACLNAAGLLLARGVARRRLLAISAALGASRGRLVRQLLTESTVLSLAGGAAGLGVAALLLRAVPALAPVEVARLEEVGIDGTVFAFTAGLSLAVGLLCGAGPALQRLHLVRALAEGGAHAAGGSGRLRTHRVRTALSAAQIAAAVVLLIGAGLFLRSFAQLLAFDRGFDPSNVVTAEVSNPMGFAPREMAARMPEIMASHRQLNERLFDEVSARLLPLPAVEAVGLSRYVPFGPNRPSSGQLRPAGTPVPSDPNEMPRTALQVVSPGYLDALRFRLRAGRTFTPRDGRDAPRVLVANETLARALFGAGPAVGRQVTLGLGEPWEIVGVVGDVVYGGLDLTGETQAEAYFPVAQATEMFFGFSQGVRVSVRTTTDPLAVVPFLREAIAAANPRATVRAVATMEARLSNAVAWPRLYAFFVGSLAGLALLLAAVGVYGLLSYTVAQREREIGIRMALGARGSRILALVAGQGAALAGAGALVGMGAAAAARPLLQSFLHGVATGDRLTFLAAPLVLAAAALVACWFPARRAARVDPAKMLRQE